MGCSNSTSLFNYLAGAMQTYEPPPNKLLITTREDTVLSMPQCDLSQLAYRVPLRKLMEEYCVMLLMYINNGIAILRSMPAIQMWWYLPLRLLQFSKNVNVG